MSGGIEIRERNRVVWTSRSPSEMARSAAGVQSAVAVIAATRHQQQLDTVVLELAGVGSSSYQIVATRHPLLKTDDPTTKAFLSAGG